MLENQAQNPEIDINKLTEYLDTFTNPQIYQTNDIPEIKGIRGLEFIHHFLAEIDGKRITIRQRNVHRWGYGFWGQIFPLIAALDPDLDDAPYVVEDSYYYYLIIDGEVVVEEKHRRNWFGRSIVGPIEKLYQKLNKLYPRVYPERKDEDGWWF